LPWFSSSAGRIIAVMSAGSRQIPSIADKIICTILICCLENFYLHNQ
jgi:hypothetical protein